MPPVARRPVSTPPPAPAGVPFLSRNFYTGSSALQEGDYALEFGVQMYKGKVGPERLCVMVTAHDLADASAQPKQVAYSMGSKAHLSFQPNPETGKGVVAVPGGPAGTATNSSNWFYFLDSMFNSGLPEEVVADGDLSAIDGTHVHIQNIPEPEDRRNFKTAGGNTGEAGQQQEDRRPGFIAVVTEIKEDGKPWEGTGGIPSADEPAPAPVKAGPKGVVKPLAKPVVRKPVAVVEPEPEAGGDEETMAVGAVADWLGKFPQGGKKVAARIHSFNYIKKAADDATAKAVVDAYFASDDALNSVLGALGYVAVGGDIKVS